MEWLLPLVLGAMALFYICQPLLSGASSAQRQTKFEGWHSLEQLEIDRNLGKIDEAEWEELKKRVPVEAPLVAPGARSLESLIFGVRRQKRIHLALESEVLIARARRKK
ncbi:hypothetical protein B1R32_101288 [Abditibacterium utsteinense]|uniref:Uncharacterized protein n=1 Tax=Abditibacterium utsteinense TaxID=1960156 RepID=A0A2S8SXM8_9BACT|nr:hypothetical protein [Abditibacterium utsteinense]PQV65546.1 hypothetical protein B1R32_101288 [Abditibacterium utsteinense]